MTVTETQMSEHRQIYEYFMSKMTMNDKKKFIKILNLEYILTKKEVEGEE